MMRAFTWLLCGALLAAVGGAGPMAPDGAAAASAPEPQVGRYQIACAASGAIVILDTQDGIAKAFLPVADDDGGRRCILETYDGRTGRPPRVVRQAIEVVTEGDEVREIRSAAIAAVIDERARREEAEARRRACEEEIERLRRQYEDGLARWQEETAKMAGELREMNDFFSSRMDESRARFADLEHRMVDEIRDRDDAIAELRARNDELTARLKERLKEREEEPKP
ncbi:MAG: hypothetical protein JXP34_21030 [Planctomycetes bacterium]|nr:hypothetical protein [Planctomycetota bacterium]